MVSMMLASLSGNTIGLFIGSFAKDAQTAIEISPAIYSPFIAFAGIVINPRNMADAIAWLQYLTPFRYLFELLMRNEYEGAEFGSEQVDIYGLELGLGTSFVLLIVTILVYRILSYIFLAIVTKKSKLL